MNTKAVIPLFLAVVLGLVAAFMVKNAIAHRNAPQQQSANLVTVVIAKQDVEPGRQLGKDDLIISKIPADAAPGQVFADPTQLVGRVVTTQLVKGQTILETLLAPTGTAGGLQALVPPGMRAITLEVTEFSGVGGMLTPGAHVDVISVVHDAKGAESIARTILQNIKVQAVGRSVSNTPAPDAQAQQQQGPPQAATNVTLLCTPKQAQSLELAKTTGRPWLVLRSGQDGKEMSVEGTTMAELRGDNNDATASTTPTETIETQLPPAPASPDPFVPQVTPPADPAPVAAAVEAPPATVKRTVQVLRGGSESQVTFVMPNPRAATADVSSPEDH